MPVLTVISTILTVVLFGMPKIRSSPAYLAGDIPGVMVQDGGTMIFWYTFPFFCRSDLSRGIRGGLFRPARFPYRGSWFDIIGLDPWADRCCGHAFAICGIT
jgi:hypothetical protein